MRKEVSHMAKKILAICAALVAFAAVPAVASAAPELVNGAGTKVATGSAITGTNVGNTVMTTSIGNVECTTAVMSGTLTKNSGTEIEGDIESASFKGTESGERCSGPLGATEVTIPSLPWCIRATKSMEPDEMQVRGGKCSETSRALTFTLHGSIFGFPVTCHYSKASVSGTYRTKAAGDAQVTITKQKFTRETGSSGSCPESGELDMSFTLETDTTSGSEEPLYIQ
jgi:hypothetical protein